MPNARRTDLGVVVAIFASLICTAGLLAFPSASRAEANNATLGTPFNLIDDRGQPITEKALQGHPSLIYFGYTHCPELCPTTLYDMADWFKALGPEGEKVRGYFFTVDPERDTPEVMHAYIGNFTSRITGITGDPEEMRKVIDGWLIYAEKVPTQDGDYTVDHTSSVLMVDGQGNLRGTLHYGEDKDVVLRKIRDLLRGGLPILPISRLRFP